MSPDSAFRSNSPATTASKNLSKATVVAHAWFGPVYDGTEEQIVFRADPSDPNDTPLSVQYLCVGRPDLHIDEVNTAMPVFLGQYCRWHGNLLVIAFRPDGTVVDFDDTHRAQIKTFLQHLDAVSCLSLALHAHRAAHRTTDYYFPPPPRCLSTEVFRCGLLEELYAHALTFCDVASLAAIADFHAPLRATISGIFYRQAREHLLPFVSECGLRPFLTILDDVKAFIYGDVPLAILLRLPVTATCLDICVPRYYVHRLANLLLRFGYHEMSTSGSATAYRRRLHLRHLRNSLDVLISESTGRHAITVPLSLRSSLSTTLMSGSSLYSLYTPHVDKRVAIVGHKSMELTDVAIAAGFSLAVDAKGLTSPCGLYCPRRLRSLATKTFPIAADAEVRDILVLGRPGPQLPEFDLIYAKQCAQIAALVASDRGEGIPACAPFCPLPLSGSADEFVHIVLPPKYYMTTRAVAWQSPESEARLDDIYDPSLLPDHEPAHFESDHHHLVQLAIYDVDRSLVRPWEQYTKLAPGTLVLAAFTLSYKPLGPFVRWVLRMTTLTVLIPADVIGAGRL
ncbi:hypothetical protein EYR36_010061 [Pleurotus pulmonarius]|nr:hypothetical protein EYR36_010061 [Pleurotus pulmonarius]